MGEYAEGERQRDRQAEKEVGAQQKVLSGGGEHQSERIGLGEENLRVTKRVPGKMRARYAKKICEDARQTEETRKFNKEKGGEETLDRAQRGNSELRHKKNLSRRPANYGLCFLRRKGRERFSLQGGKGKKIHDAGKPRDEEASRFPLMSRKSRWR